MLFPYRKPDLDVILKRAESNVTDQRHVLAFSCQTRNFCPSCQAKRAALLGETVAGEVAAPVAHRHVVFTVPKALRGLFERDRGLLGLLSRCVYESVRRTWVAGFGEPRAVPGMVSSIQTFGSYANFHPHIHALVTNGVVTWQGEWLPLPEWTPGVIEEVFRRLVLRELVNAQRLSEEFREVLLTWERTGFSVYGEHVVVEGEEEHLERLVRYMVRPPMAVGIVEKTEAGNVRLQTPVDPRTGARGMELDPLEWIHALARQVPDPRQHLVRYYGLYANRSRAQWRSRWQGARSWSGGHRGRKDRCGHDTPFGDDAEEPGKHTRAHGDGKVCLTGGRGTSYRELGRGEKEVSGDRESTGRRPEAPRERCATHVRSPDRLNPRPLCGHDRLEFPTLFYAFFYA